GGRPVVAFDLPEHRFTAQDAALYVRPNDELEMARAIALLMDDPERRRRMGMLGRRRVETTLAWSHSVPNLLAAYRALGPTASQPVEPSPKRTDETPADETPADKAIDATVKVS